MNRNYQKELDRIIQKQGQTRPRVLLHACCGVCSGAVLEYLTQYFEVTVLWYNPNLYPQAEFDRRFQALVQMIERMGLADRVSVLRLLETARLARHYGYDYFCTTLTLSRHKDEKRINALGEEIGQAAGMAWLPSDFKKQGREMRSRDLANEHGIYQQLYCGCEYSLHKREEQGEGAT